MKRFTPALLAKLEEIPRALPDRALRQLGLRLAGGVADDRGEVDDGVEAVAREQLRELRRASVMSVFENVNAGCDRRSSSDSPPNSSASAATTRYPRDSRSRVTSEPM